MAIIRFHQPFGGPSREIDRIRQQVDRVFRDTTGGISSRDFSGVFPAVNVYEGEGQYMLTAELPGVNPIEVEITVTGDSMTIRGERKTEEPGEDVNYHRRERESGFFRRVVTLPDKVNPDKVEATSRNGIIQIRLPKAEELKPRRIQVKGS